MRIDAKRLAEARDKRQALIESGLVPKPKKLSDDKERLKAGSKIQNGENDDNCCF